MECLFARKVLAIKIKIWDQLAKDYGDESFLSLDVTFDDYEEKDTL